jgi:hypothetical protein
MAFILAPDLGSYDALLSFLYQRGYRFFIFDKQTGVFLYPDMEHLRYPENRPGGLVPIFVHDKRDYAIYRVGGAAWPEPRPLGAKLENGIVLTGYELYQSADLPQGSGRRLGVYLHWKATAPVSSFLKVFVHVFDEAGQLVTQHDGIPALWTSPTLDWTTGDTVVDFHPLLFDTALGRGPFTIRVGLYDAGTLQRIPVLDSAADPSGQAKDYVVLETFVFD